MMNSKKILLVDDDVDIIEFLSYNLKKEGYIIETCNNGAQAIKKAVSFMPDLILLDIMMPEIDGIEACEEIRKNENLDNIIIAFLTARNEDYSYVAGFNAGADDYITKPIKPRLLISKVHSLLRRKINLSDTTYINEQKEFETKLITNSVIIDKDRYVVVKDDTDILLPRKEFELLALLASNTRKVFTREEIFSKIWGEDNFISDRTIDVHIRKIRKRIGENVIRTVKGVGYKFVDL